MWIVITLSLVASDLDTGRTALAEFQYETAVTALERARSGGPHAWRDHVSLYETLGIAYASLGRVDAARATFEMLLALDPGHAIPYTLAPKVTFVFETARRELAGKPPTELALNWPQGLTVNAPVPLSLAVIADSARLLTKATLHARRKGESTYTTHELTLSPTGQFQTLELAPPPELATKATDLEIYVVAHDAKGNEVLEFASARTPRIIALGYEEHVPWYGRWWVWAAAAGVVAAGVGVGVYLAVQSPPEDVPAELGLDW